MKSPKQFVDAMVEGSRFEKKQACVRDDPANSPSAAGELTELYIAPSVHESSEQFLAQFPENAYTVCRTVNRQPCIYLLDTHLFRLFQSFCTLTFEFPTVVAPLPYIEKHQEQQHHSQQQQRGPQKQQRQQQYPKQLKPNENTKELQRWQEDLTRKNQQRQQPRQCEKGEVKKLQKRLPDRAVEQQVKCLELSAEQQVQREEMQSVREQRRDEEERQENLCQQGYAKQQQRQVQELQEKVQQQQETQHAALGKQLRKIEEESQRTHHHDRGLKEQKKQQVLGSTAEAGDIAANVFAVGKETSKHQLLYPHSKSCGRRHDFPESGMRTTAFADSVKIPSCATAATHLAPLTGGNLTLHKAAPTIVRHAAVALLRVLLKHAAGVVDSAAAAAVSSNTTLPCDFRFTLVLLDTAESYSSANRSSRISSFSNSTSSSSSSSCSEDRGRLGNKDRSSSSSNSGFSFSSSTKSSCSSSSGNSTDYRNRIQRNGNRTSSKSKMAHTKTPDSKEGVRQDHLCSAGEALSIDYLSKTLHHAAEADDCAEKKHLQFLSSEREREAITTLPTESLKTEATERRGVTPKSQISAAANCHSKHGPALWGRVQFRLHAHTCFPNQSTPARAEMKGEGARATRAAGSTKAAGLRDISLTKKNRFKSFLDSYDGQLEVQLLAYMQPLLQHRYQQQQEKMQQTWKAAVSTMQASGISPEKEAKNKAQTLSNSATAVEKTAATAATICAFREPAATALEITTTGIAETEKAPETAEATAAAIVAERVTNVATGEADTATAAACETRSAAATLDEAGCFVVALCHEKRYAPEVKRTSWLKEKQWLLQQAEAAAAATAAATGRTGDDSRDLVEEVLLVGKNGEIYEGLSSNFFVYSSTRDTVLTSGKGSCLAGTVREITLKICRDKKIQVSEEAPIWHQRNEEKWTAAFLTSTSRLALPIKCMRFYSKQKLQHLPDYGHSSSESNNSSSGHFDSGRLCKRGCCSSERKSDNKNRSCNNKQVCSYNSRGRASRSCSCNDDGNSGSTRDYQSTKRLILRDSQERKWRHNGGKTKEKSLIENTGEETDEIKFDVSASSLSSQMAHWVLQYACENSTRLY